MAFFGGTDESGLVECSCAGVCVGSDKSFLMLTTVVPFIAGAVRCSSRKSVPKLSAALRLANLAAKTMKVVRPLGSRSSVRQDEVKARLTR